MQALDDRAKELVQDHVTLLSFRAQLHAAVADKVRLVNPRRHRDALVGSRSWISFLSFALSDHILISLRMKTQRFKQIVHNDLALSSSILQPRSNISKNESHGTSK